MKKALQLITTLAILAFAATAVHAQSVTARLSQLTKTYSLDDAQQKQVKALLDEQAAQLKAVAADSSLDKSTRSKKSADITQATNNKIVALLRPEQSAPVKMKRLAEENKARLSQLTKKYDLSDEQQTKVEALLAADTKDIGALYADASLDETTRKRQFDKLRANTNKQITDLLTSGQKEIQKRTAAGQ